MRLKIILYFLVIGYQSVVYANEAVEYQQFFEQLTYKNALWKADDYGSSPSDRTIALLKKHAPRFWLSKSACMPMNFYEQYVPQLISEKGDGQWMKGSRENLKRYERDFSIEWQLNIETDCIESQSPPLYAYSWSEKMRLADGNEKSISILKYAFTFYKSGLPAKQTTVQSLVKFLGDPDIWHYLDIHGAIYYLLDEKENLFSVVIAQHNHFRSYVVGVDVSATEIKRICFAKRSNEPYFCGKDIGPYELPTAPTYENIRWIVTNKNRPLLGAWDIIPSPNDRKEIQYDLTFLTSKDPLISSWVSLGPELKIFGIFSTIFRKAPPGMAVFNTPTLKEIWKTAIYYYFDPNNEAVFLMHETNMDDFFHPDVADVFQLNAKRYEQSLAVGNRNLHYATDYVHRIK